MEAYTASRPVKMNFLTPDDDNYPVALKTCLAPSLLPRISALGNLDILTHKTVGLFCSIKCPGSLILQTYDLARQLRQVGITVIGGFHSPMERECLTILLRGPQPVILCPARNIGPRTARERAQLFEQGRLLLLSPFDSQHTRMTSQTARERNRFVAALADTVFVAHAEPGGKMGGICRDVLSWGKPLYTFESDANAHLTAWGAIPVNPETAVRSFVAALS
jgi:predicted Rossmann fold nucleotide-binding protein DprA/Smf involved in DNA uptake